MVDDFIQMNGVFQIPKVNTWVEKRLVSFQLRVFRVKSTTRLSAVKLDLYRLDFSVRIRFFDEI